MSFKMTGVIKSIGDKKTLDNGAVVLDYVVDHTNDNGYVTPLALSMYQTGDSIKFIDQFIENHKVGDHVDVEFNIRGKEYNNRIYNSLSHWRCEKQKTKVVEMNEPTDTGLPF